MSTEDDAIRLLSGGEVALITERDSRKTTLIRRAGRITLCVQGTVLPYQYASAATLSATASSTYGPQHPGFDLAEAVDYRHLAHVRRAARPDRAQAGRGQEGDDGGRPAVLDRVHELGRVELKPKGVVAHVPVEVEARNEIPRLQRGDRQGEDGQ